MDNHPIPQDVTGFQFRLIGSMTVKQFAYVAVGAVAAVIFFYIPISGWFTLIKMLLIPASILGGVVLAFVPIEGRPVDIMVTNFLKALIAPNQFVYHREGGQLLLSTIHISPKIAGQAATAPTGTPGEPRTSVQAQRQVARQQQLTAYLNTIHQAQAPDDKEASRLTALFSPSAPMPTTTTPPGAAPVTEPAPAAAVPSATAQPPLETLSATQIQAEVPTPSATPDTETAVQIQKDIDKIAEDDALIQQMNAQLTQAKSAEQQAGTDPSAGQSAHAKAAEFEQKLQELMATKAALEQELQSLKKQQPAAIATTPVTTVPVSQAQPAPNAAPAPTATSTLPSATDAAAKPAKGSFPSLPDAPNILLGIVRDSSGNVLPNILVEVTDSEGNPVRAFKTNQLGQFMSATQLKEGNYTITFEDSKNQYKFDPTPVAVNNQILQPLEIAAHDAREALRKALFA